MATLVREPRYPLSRQARDDADMRRVVGIGLAAIAATAAGFGAGLSVAQGPSGPTPSVRSARTATGALGGASTALPPRPLSTLSFRLHDLGPDAFSTVACTTSRRCLALGPEGWEAKSDDGGYRWMLSLNPNLAGLTADELACPAPQRCVAVATPIVNSPSSSEPSTAAEEAAAPPDVLLVSSDAGASWQRARAPGGLWLGGFSCPTQGFCYASAERRGRPSSGVLLHSSDGGLVWTIGASGPRGGLGAISCASVGHCWAIGGPTGLAVTTDSGVRWRPEHDSVGFSEPLPLSVIDCSTASRCIGLGEDIGPAPADGVPWMALYAVATTDGGTHWHRVLVDPDYSQMVYPGFDAASCSDAGRYCVAVGTLGTVALSTDFGLEWRVENPRAGPFEALDDTTRAAALGCLIAGTASDGGGVLASVASPEPEHVAGPTASESAGGSGSRRRESSTQGALVMRLRSIGGDWTSLSCPDANYCVAVGGGPAGEGPLFAEVMTSNDGGWNWTEQRPPPGVLGLAAIDCPSVSRCYATGLALLNKPTPLTNEIAVVLESRDGGRTWKRVGRAPEIVEPSSISCPSVTTCFAVGSTVTSEDGSSQAIVATTDGGRRWFEEEVPANLSGVLLADIACPSTSRCWAGGPSGLVATIDGGANWQDVVPDYLEALSCPSVRRCVAIGVGRGAELVGSGLAHRFVTGAAPEFQPSSSEMTCPSSTICVAAGASDGTPSQAAAF